METETTTTTTRTPTKAPTTATAAAAALLREAAGALAAKLTANVASSTPLAPLPPPASGSCRWTLVRVGEKNVAVKGSRDENDGVKGSDSDDGDGAGNGRLLEALAEFVGEARVMARLARQAPKHPNVYALEGIEASSSSLPRLLASPFCGTPLFAWLLQAPSKTHCDIASVLAQFASAVAYLHGECGIVHGNVCEEVVLVNGEGRVTVVNLTTAAYTRSPTTCRCDDERLEYAAPEQLMSRSGRWPSSTRRCGHCRRCRHRDAVAGETHAVGIVALCAAQRRSTGGLPTLAHAGAPSTTLSSSVSWSGRRLLHRRATTAMIAYWGKTKTLQFWARWQAEEEARGASENDDDDDDHRHHDHDDQTPVAHYERVARLSAAKNNAAQKKQLAKKERAEEVVDDDEDRRTGRCRWLTGLAVALIQPLPGHRRSVAWMRDRLAARAYQKRDG